MMYWNWKGRCCRIYSLGEIKAALGDNYQFSSNMTHDEVKRTIGCGDNNADGEVPFILQAGNLAISMDIYSEDDKDVWPIYYYRKEFDDESCWIFIGDDVILDVPDIEAEVFRVLDKLAEEKGLSFFIQNNEYGNSPENSSELER